MISMRKEKQFDESQYKRLIKEKDEILRISDNTKTNIANSLEMFKEKQKEFTKKEKQFEKDILHIHKLKIKQEHDLTILDKKKKALLELTNKLMDKETKLIHR